MEAVGEDSFTDHVWEVKELKLIVGTRLGRLHIFDISSGKKEAEKTIQLCDQEVKSLVLTKKYLLAATKVFTLGK